MNKFVTFGKIGQFRQALRDMIHQETFVGVDQEGKPIYNNTKRLPTVKATGTVKLHGTNAGVGISSDGVSQTIWAQSRNNIITPEKDNAGFAFFVENHKDVFYFLLNAVKFILNVPHTDHLEIVVYGEWCGKGIQKGVGISQLDKMFVIFGIKIVTNDDLDNYWLNKEQMELNNMEYVRRSFNSFDPERDIRIFSIDEFPTYEIDIHLERPEHASQKLTELTEKVEAECPVAKHFGISGIGEGIVWTIENKDGSQIRFKVKGEKHSSSKVKTLAPVDIEKLRGVNEFVEYSCTENRLQQGIEYVFAQNSLTPDVKQLGDFIRWVVNDITSEESDTLHKNGLEPKDVNKYISTEARKWFFKNYS